MAVGDMMVMPMGRMEWFVLDIDTKRRIRSLSGLFIQTIYQGTQHMFFLEAPGEDTRQLLGHLAILNPLW